MKEEDDPLLEGMTWLLVGVIAICIGLLLAVGLIWLLGTLL